MLPTHLTKRTLRLTGLASLAILSATATAFLLENRADAARPLAPPPPVVVTVNLPAVLEKLDQRADAQAEVQRIADQMMAEDKTWQQRNEEMKARAQTVPESDIEARTRLNEDVTLMALEYQAWSRFAMQQIDLEKSLRLRDLDRIIRAEIRQLAEINGYDIVVTDDSAMELLVNPDSNASREQQVKQQMTSRRILHVNAAADITDQLIQRMNNTYNAGGRQRTASP